MRGSASAPAAEGFLIWWDRLGRSRGPSLKAMKNLTKLWLAALFRPRVQQQTASDALGLLKLEEKKGPVKKAWDVTEERVGRSSATHLLAKGQVVRFENRSYRKKPAGNLVRVDPVKPYRNRAEQKQYLKARRREREAAAGATYGSYGAE